MATHCSKLPDGTTARFDNLDDAQTYVERFGRGIVDSPTKPNGNGPILTRAFDGAVWTVIGG